MNTQRKRRNWVEIVGLEEAQGWFGFRGKIDLSLVVSDSPHVDLHHHRVRLPRRRVLELFLDPLELGGP